MSSTKWIAFLALLGAAFGAGHMVGSSSSQHAAPELTTSSAPGPGNGEPPGSVLQGSPGPTLAVSSAGDSESAPFERALAELPPLDIPRGKGRIDVTVKTEDGTGLQGVHVTCFPEIPVDLTQPRRQGWQDDVPASLVLLDAAKRLQWRKEALLEAVTDGSGACSFEGLTQVKHALTAQAEGWAIRSVMRGAHDVEPGTAIHFAAKPRTCIRVEVVMPDGTAPEKAQVRFHRGSGMSGRSWTPDRPDVDADPGTWEVSATAGDGERLLSPTEQVTVEVGSPPPLVRLQLVERTSLVTTVESAPGEGRVPVVLRQVRMPSGVEPDPALLGSSSERLPLRPSGPRSSSNTRLDLEPGTWMVGVYRSWEGPLIVSRTLEVKPGRNELSLQLPPTPRDAYALVRVRGPDGQPLGGLSFLASFESEDGRSSGGGATVMQGPPGEYWVFHPGPHPASVGDVRRISVEHRRLGKKLFTYTAEDAAPTFDVRFEEPATVAVVVEGLEGDRYAGRLSVQVSADVEADHHMMTSGFEPRPVGASGSAVIAALQPGTYRIELQLTRAPWGGPTLVEQMIEVRTGEQSVRLRVPTLHVVEIEGVTAQAHLQRTDVDPRRGFMTVVQPGADGRAIVDGLVAGEYRLEMGTKVSTFRLPGTSTVRIE